jgi:LacI family fructose operon transcriptional repressor
MTSIKDVAEAAGVSTATVSRVLSNKPHVSDELRQRVLLAVERLDYRPNLIARSLRTRQSDTIGLVVADIRNPYFTAVSRAVEDMAYEQGISVYLCNTDEDPHKEALYLQVLRKENVAGIIFSPTRKSEQDLQGFDIPTVAIDRPVRSAQVDSVLIDNFDAAYKLTEHLIQNGYRRISALFGAASSTGRERRRGFEQALNDHDLQIPSPGLVNYVQPKVGSGREAALEMLPCAKKACVSPRISAWWVLMIPPGQHWSSRASPSSPSPRMTSDARLRNCCCNASPIRSALPVK